MPLESRPFVVLPGAGDRIAGPAGGPLTFKARGEQTGGRLTAIENLIAPGSGPPLHVHADEDEAWWIVEGELRFRLGEEEARAPAGTFVWVPRGVAHAFQAVGPAAARILVLFTPAGMERFFDRFAEPSDEPPPQKFASIGREVDAVAREIIDAAGHAEHFGHGLGHGVGLEVHEGPRLSKQGDDPLAAGNVVTVEPGIYVPGAVGVRIEDLVAVTPEGHEVLSGLSKALRTVG